MKKSQGAGTARTPPPRPPPERERNRSPMSFTVPPGPLASVYRMDDFRTDLPQDPPVDVEQVWGEIMAAAQLFGVLRDAGMSVRFDAEDPDGPPRVRIT